VVSWGQLSACTMSLRILLRMIGWLGLGLTLAPCFFYYVDVIDLDGLKQLMIVGMGLWFVTSPIVQRLA
jgi:hypothetical protein